MGSDPVDSDAPVSVTPEPVHPTLVHPVEPRKPQTVSKWQPRSLRDASSEIAVVDFTYKDGSRKSFPGSRVNCKDEEWMSTVYPTVVVPPRTPGRFWIHKAADKNHPNFFSDEELKVRAKNTLGVSQKLEAAAKKLGFEEMWFIVDEDGEPIEEHGKWFPATEEEIAIAKDPSAKPELSRVSDRLACVDVTFKDGQKISFPGSEVNCDNEAWTTLMQPTVVPPPRTPGRFWVHKAADKNHPNFFNDEELRQIAYDTLGVEKKLEEAAAELEYEEMWFIVDSAGNPLEEDGKWFPATEEEIKRAKDPLGLHTGS